MNRFLFEGLTRYFAAVVLFLWIAAPSALGGEPFVAGYQVEDRYLILNASFRGSDDALIAFDAMTPQEIATIYHELWHAWFIEVESKRGGALYKRFREQAARLYPQIPEDHRQEVYEEAVADFIDAVVATHVQMKRFLWTKTPQRREEIRKDAQYMALFSELYQEKYRGYYTRKIELVERSAPTPPAASASLTTATAAATAPSTVVKKGASADSPALKDMPTSAGALQYQMVDPHRAMDGFLRQASAFGLPVGYLREAVDRLKNVVYLKMDIPSGALMSDAVWADAPLDPQDLDLVQKTLFESLLTKNPLEVFAESRF